MAINTIDSQDSIVKDAINVIADIMNDTNSNAATRLQAAQTILNIAGINSITEENEQLFDIYNFL